MEIQAGTEDSESHVTHTGWPRAPWEELMNTGLWRLCPKESKVPELEGGRGEAERARVTAWDMGWGGGGHVAEGGSPHVG